MGCSQSVVLDVESLTKLRNDDPEEFDKIVAQVQYKAREPRPLFPKDVFVADIPKIPEAEVEAFKAKYVDNTYLSKEEAKERMKSIQGTRDCQYARWKWAKSNFSTYVNMLRVCGHPDESIQAMLAGRPLCFREQKTYDDFCAALRAVKPQVEKELGLECVGFVFTGSSVPGFSQNPCKGKHLVPSKITSISKSDVDLCMKADGINDFVESIKEEGINCTGYPTTCTPYQGAMRFSLRPGSMITPGSMDKCPALASFYKEWSEKLAGGLQLTMCEDGLGIPPWEARVDMTPPANKTDASVEVKA